MVKILNSLKLILLIGLLQVCDGGSLFSQTHNEFIYTISPPSGDMADKLKRLVFFYHSGQEIWGKNGVQFGTAVQLEGTVFEVWAETLQGKVFFGELDFSIDQDLNRISSDPGVILKVNLSSTKLNSQIAVDLNVVVNSR